MFYKLYLVTTIEEFCLLSMYCDAKPFWWNWFFGWRKTRCYDTVTYYYFRIPNSAYHNCLTYAKMLGVETL